MIDTRITSDWAISACVDGVDLNAELKCVRRERDKLKGELELAISKIKQNDNLLEKMKENIIPSAKRILKNGDYMTVLWDDGTKTIVKRAADEAESDYAAFTAALGIKCFGSNSALKRIVASAEVQNKKKKKKRAEESEFDKIGRAFTEASKALALELQRLRDVDDAYDQQKTDEWLDSVEKKQNDNRS